MDHVDDVPGPLPDRPAAVGLHTAVRVFTQPRRSGRSDVPGVSAGRPVAAQRGPGPQPEPRCRPCWNSSTRCATTASRVVREVRLLGRRSGPRANLRRCGDEPSTEATRRECTVESFDRKLRRPRPDRGGGPCGQRGPVAVIRPSANTVDFPVGHRSSSSEGEWEPEQHTMMWSLRCCSLGLRKESRWSGVPSSTRTAHDPQVPSLHE